VSLTGDTALFPVAWIIWLGWNDAEQQWKKSVQNGVSLKENSPLYIVPLHLRGKIQFLSH